LKLNSFIYFIMTTSTEIAIDWALAAGTFVLFVAYHGYLACRVHWYPLKTVIGINHLTRRRWVYAMMRSPGHQHGILAVQTLRNAIMAASLLASTAILLASTLAGFAASSDKWTALDALLLSFSKAALSPTSDQPALPRDKMQRIAIKFLILIVTFLASFFCYSQAIRLYNHVNFLINVPEHISSNGDASPSEQAFLQCSGPVSSALPDGIPPLRESPALSKATPASFIDYVADCLEKGANFYTIGTRIFYLAMLLLLWLFGAVFMLVASVFFLIILFFLDRTNLTSLVQQQQTIQP
jgi:uncharacterized membrane protein